MARDDPCMKKIHSALEIWILRAMGLIRDDNVSKEVTDTLPQLSKKPPWETLRALVVKSEVQHLNQAQWKLYRKLHRECATMLIAEAADVVVCTFAELANGEIF